MSDSAIAATGLVRHFGQVKAVDGIDLEVRRGEIYGFLGPNGAGKSTCVRVFTTLLKPTAGSVVVAGYNVATHPDDVRIRIGAALQEAALDPKQTGRELLRLQARLYGLPERRVLQRIEELSKLVDIGDAMDRLIGTYSGGMERRLDLAAALVHNPEVLFLDEPTTGLDPISRANVWDEVRRINKSLGVTVFLTTQYLAEADSLSERVGIVNRGKLVMEGPPADLKRSLGSDVIVVRVEGDTAHAAEAVRQVNEVAKVEVHGDELTVSVTHGASMVSSVAVALNSRGIPVKELTLRTPTLDDVFLVATGARFGAEQSSNGAKADDPKVPEGIAPKVSKR